MPLTVVGRGVPARRRQDAHAGQHLADEHGFHATFARIAGENPASIALHSKHGFEMVGVEREVGRKFGQWLDVTVMQRLANGT